MRSVRGERERGREREREGVRERERESRQRDRAQYADNQNISFLPAIVSTSTRMHGKFLRLVLLQAHRETEAHLNTAGMSSQNYQTDAFRFKRGFPPVTEEQDRPNSQAPQVLLPPFWGVVLWSFFVCNLKRMTCSRCLALAARSTVIFFWPYLQVYPPIRSTSSIKLFLYADNSAAAPFGSPLDVLIEANRALAKETFAVSESSKYPTPYVSNPLLNPTPLGVPPPRWGARRGPERSGGPRRDSSLQESHPSRCPAPLLGGPARAGATTWRL